VTALEGRHELQKFLISFPTGAMDSIREDELSEVDAAAHAVIDEAKDAGVYVFSGGLFDDVAPVMVATDGTATEADYPQTKDFHEGFAIVEAPSREEALKWAAKLAAACRCTQEVREFGHDPRA
jgi:hypothetical protein